MQEVPPIQEVPPYTGSPALYRKSRPYTGSPTHIPEVPPLYRKPRPYTGSSAHLSSIILTGGVWYLLLLWSCNFFYECQVHFIVIDPVKWN